MTLSSHHKRLLTAGVLGLVVAVALFVGGWLLFLVALAASCQGLFEFYSLYWPGRRRAWLKAAGMLLGAAVLLGAMHLSPGWSLAGLLIAFWLAAFLFLFRQGRPDGEDFTEWFVVAAGVLYVPAMLQFVLHFQAVEILLVLLAVIASDAGAYYAGSWFGKKKLWPAISPKKTWVGSFGGLVLCGAVCLALGSWLGKGAWQSWILLGVVLAVAAQLGDLFESALKRSRDVKDSGRLLPGHGGLLDRMDSLLLAVPVYAAARALYTFF